MLNQDVPFDYHVWLADEGPTDDILAWCYEQGVNISCRKGRSPWLKGLIVSSTMAQSSAQLETCVCARRCVCISSTSLAAPDEVQGRQLVLLLREYRLTRFLSSRACRWRKLARSKRLEGGFVT